MLDKDPVAELEKQLADVANTIRDVGIQLGTLSRSTGKVSVPRSEVAPPEYDRPAKVATPAVPRFRTWIAPVTITTTDPGGTWTALDVSASVPEGATELTLFTVLYSDNVDGRLEYRIASGANEYQVAGTRQNGSGEAGSASQFDVPIGASRTFEIRVTSTGILQSLSLHAYVR